LKLFPLNPNDPKGVQDQTQCTGFFYQFPIQEW